MYPTSWVSPDRHAPAGETPPVVSSRWMNVTREKMPAPDVSAASSRSSGIEPGLATLTGFAP